MRNIKRVILSAFVFTLIILVVGGGCSTDGNYSEEENEQVESDESIVALIPEPKPNESVSEITSEPVSEEQDRRQEDFDRLVSAEDVIVFAENGWPSHLLSDKSLFRMKVTDVTCNERGIIEYLLNKYDKAYLMNTINFNSKFERYDALRELAGIDSGDNHVAFCKINMEVERIWTYDNENTLSLDRGLFSAKYYSEILGEYSGTAFDSSTTLFLADDSKTDELQFSEDKNSYQVEVITVVHYDEYSNNYDDYNVMFSDTIVNNGRFNIRDLNGG